MAHFKVIRSGEKDGAHWTHIENRTNADGFFRSAFIRTAKALKQDAKQQVEIPDGLAKSIRWSL